MIKAIIFDCFGVLITDALQLVVKELEAEKPGARAHITQIIHANNLGLMSPHESNQQIADYVGVSIETWRQMIDTREVKDEKVLAWIRRLRTEGYKTALLSNIGRGSLYRRFTRQELDEHFDALIISAELGIAKPDEAIYRYAAKELGVEPSGCIFIDDRKGHCQGAERAGLQSILFTDYEQAAAELKGLLKLAK
jgi:putative hydrolase of the HAD superfamily